MKLFFSVFVTALTSCFNYVSATDLKAFDDTVLFKVNWPGRDGNELFDLPDGGSESMFVTTSRNEKYKCLLPTVKEKSKDSDVWYEGPNALEVLAPLFSQSSCSYRLESYWTYEVCHGQYVRQYHEDREGNKVKTQEYFLGRWDKTLHEKLSKELDSGLHSPPAIKKLDGLSLPYLQLNLTDGTVCDLNGNPRRTNVLYVCYTLGKHEIYSFKETSTCEYELVVLSSLLCEHPKYKPQETGDHPINCLPLEGTPKKPHSLLKIEAESLKLRHQRILEDERLQKVFAVFSIDKIAGKDGETRVRVELRPIDEKQTTAEAAPKPPTQQITDTSPVESFLSGENCLQGGSGWWKYEFCYGRNVDQYHVEKDGSRVVIRLGTFDRAEHIEWLNKNPHKRPKPVATRTSVSHYYGGGSICDKTGLPRETEVKLKCSESSSKGSVSLYLLEPHTCQYILGVESPLVCQLLSKFDEHGLIPETNFTVEEEDNFIVTTDTED